MTSKEKRDRQVHYCDGISNAVTDACSRDLKASVTEAKGITPSVTPCSRCLPMPLCSS